MLPTPCIGWSLVSAMMSSVGYFNLSVVITFAGLCSTLGRRDSIDIDIALLECLQRLVA